MLVRQLMGIDCRGQKVNQSDQFKVVGDQHESDLFLGGHCPQFDKCRYVIVTFAQKKPRKNVENVLIELFA